MTFIALSLLTSSWISVLLRFACVFDRFCEHSIGAICEHVFNGCAKVFIFSRISRLRRRIARVFSSFLAAGWVAGWLAGWLAGLAGAVFLRNVSRISHSLV